MAQLRRIVRDERYPDYRTDAGENGRGAVVTLTDAEATHLDRVVAEYEGWQIRPAALYLIKTERRGS